LPSVSAAPNGAALDAILVTMAFGGLDELSGKRGTGLLEMRTFALKRLI